MKKRFLITLMLSLLLVLVCMSGAMAACGATYGEVKCNGSHAEEVQWDPVNHWTVVTHNAGSSNSFQTRENSGEHDMTMSPKKTPTCLEGGLGVVYCTECGYVQDDHYEFSGPLGHKFKEIVEHSKPCQPGIAYEQCERCKVRQSEREVPAISDHSPHRCDNYVPATCTKPGKTEEFRCQYCLMLMSGGEEIPATGHDPKEVLGDKPTCCHDGWYNSFCPDCQTTLQAKVKIIPATGNHVQTRTETVKAPTCTQEGTYNEYCNTYNKIIGNGTIPKLSHELVLDHKVAATCLKVSEEHMKCKHCNYTEIWYGKITADHKPVEILAEKPTCCNDGWNMVICSVCEAKLQDKSSTIPATGKHTVVRTVTVKPTCGSEGKYEETCNLTGRLLGEGTIPATGKHNMVDASYAPTCTENGWKGTKCTVCGYQEPGVNVGSLGHLPTKKVVGKAATCTEDGYYNLDCERCGAKGLSVNVEPIPALGHKTEKQITFQPTCCDSGWYNEVCTRCDETTAVKLPIAATGNHPEDWRTVEAASCLKAEVLGLFCGNTGKPLNKTKEGKAALGHFLHNLDDHRAATCTENGQTEGFVCQRQGCPMYNEVVKGHDVIPALGHTKDGYMSVKYAPNCCDSGWYDLLCNRCDATIAVKLPIPATGKHKADWREVEPATCTTKQVLALFCGNTGKPLYEYKDGEGPNGHSWGEWVVVTPATETKEGVKEHTCTACGITETAAIDKLGGKETPKPTGNPAVTATPAPTGNPAVTATPAPTGDPAVTATPAPTGNPAVTATPAPTGDPSVTATPAPTGDPSVTATPAPTGDPAGDDDCKHVEEELKGFPPTCTEQGREDGIICGECGEVLEGGEWINPTGHKPVVIPAVEPTETEKGLTEGLKCETCGKILKEQYPVDFEGNYYDPDDPDGPSIGTEIPKKPGEIYNPEDELIGRLEDDVITDPKGEYVGSVDEEGNIIDENGNVIGKVDEDGKVTDKDGNHVGDVFGFDELEGRDEPGHPNFDLSDYLDEYYTHVEDGDKIRPTIDEDKCTIGTKEKMEGDGITVLIKGAEDYAICPVDKYPMSQWIDLGNGLHKRVCTCLDCDYYEIAACVPFDITVEEVEYHICPICGHFTEEEDYEWIKGVKVGEVGNMNEMIAREKDEPFGTAAVQVKDMDENAVTITESFTAVKSVKGVLMNWFTDETLYIPMVHPGDAKLIRMNYDGEFTDVNYVYDNGFVIFNSDEHGLYLFVK